MNRSIILTLPVLVLLFGCSTGTDEPSFTNPFDPVLGEGIPIPDSIMVTVGNNLVRLDWGISEAVDEFAIFRKRIDSDPGSEEELLVGQVATPSFQDTRVRNGRAYGYRIAAGSGDQFGRRSEEVEARPGAFSIVVSNDNPSTRDPVVSVTHSAPGSEAIQLSEDPDSFTSPWRTVTQSISWTLSPGDAVKTVYGRFRFPDGSETLPVSDSITLDTKAVIQSVDFDGSDTRSPGEVIHFRLDGDEPRGTAAIDVAGVFQALTLFDDGTGGDPVAEDGIYERDAIIPAGVTATSAVVAGSFVDESGNRATTATATRTLSVRENPAVVNLFDPFLTDPPGAAAANLRWTESQERDFSAYRVFRSAAPTVDSSDRLIGTITSIGTLELKDSDVVEGETYYYRVYVVVGSGTESGSNTVQATVTNVRPPGAVTIKTPEAVSFTSIALSWSKSTDRDFQVYRLFRNQTGAVTDSDLQVTEISDQDQVFGDDTGLRENTDYHYRVYTIDLGGLSSRSNEVMVTTRNEAPPAVVQNAASSIDTTAATMSWSESTVHDFKSYQLYRDEIPTVTTASTLVVEIDESTATSFRDTALESSTTYYYRIFVVDDGQDPGPESSGSNTITFTTF